MTYTLLKIIGVLAIAIVAIGVVASGFQNIPVGQVAVKTTKGELQQGILPEGWKLITPAVDQLIIYDTRIQLYPKELNTIDGDTTIPRIMSTSSDGQDVPTAIAMNYHVVKEKVFDVHQKIGVNYEYVVIKNVAENTIKDVMGKYTADYMYQNREDVANAIYNKLSDELGNYEGCKGCFVLDNFSISNIGFSPQFTEALERKATAKTDAETAWNKVEELKAIAQQNIEASKGQAEAIKTVNEALEQSPLYIEWLKAKTLQERWDGALPKVVGDGQPLLNMRLD